MASQSWIDAAAQTPKKPMRNEMDTSANPVVGIARADADYEARERVRAAEAVQRIGGEHAGELIAMLGLDGTELPPAPRRKPVRHHEPPAEKTCPRCGETKVAAEYVARPRHADGLDTNCRACNRRRKNEWAAGRARAGVSS
jgi:hypothetical protein